MRYGNLEFTDREPTDDETEGISWWNALPDAERACWLARAATAVPAQAWAAYKAARDQCIVIENRPTTHPDPHTVVFTGKRGARETTVRMLVDGEPRPLPNYREVRNHSPSGFEWGYLGSGPAQLALAMCVELVGVERALAAYQHVKEKLLAPITVDEWALSGVLVMKVIAEAEGGPSPAGHGPTTFDHSWRG